ncbi:PIGV-like protein [Mya arenaria]|uniref:GPI mannosyltransferase 2 n=1 Tax=Mya arenaria TaxID=6604 RepID=A0ABY7DYW8_MYAAR|nr:GPI mannosyltransferase 2-like [Mya arenaria]WAR02114.1 PIGV-like protein [Mya arenaria]
MAAPMNNKHILLKKIAFFAISCRLATMIIQVVSNILLPDHDADAFKPPYDINEGNLLDSIIQSLFGGLRRWDGVYFLHIAEHGYTYENTLAFFPLFPTFVRLTANSVLLPLQFLVQYSSVLLVSAVLVNVTVFVRTAEVLFSLGSEVLKNDAIAYKAALLFCITPASIFMTAPYSECLYSFLTFSGLLELHQNRKTMAAVYFGLSFVTRSNGALNMFFLLYVLGKSVLKEIRNLSRAAMMNWQVSLAIPWIFFTTTVIPYLFLVVICVIPFLGYQLYCFKLYCIGAYKLDIAEHIVAYGRENGLKIQGDEPSSWCQDKLPLAYSYIQSHYWDQGFLQYWEWKQTPNFLLATPATLLVLSLAWKFWKNNKYVCVTLGLDEDGAAKKEADPGPHFRLVGVALLPHVVQSLALTVFAWACIHIQVLTRMVFSSCPVLYWYSAHLISPGEAIQKQFNRYDITSPDCPQVERDENLHETWRNKVISQLTAFQQQDLNTRIVTTYFVSYCLIGTVAFSNFLPWT